MLVKNQEVTLTIEDIASDGNGVSRYMDFVVFVPYTAVGDVITAKIVKVKKKHAFGIIVNLLKESPHRIDSGCIHFQKCGGCSLRHLDYKEELRLKKNFVVNSLNKIGNIDFPVEEVIPSPDISKYRNKVQLPVYQDKNGLNFGFYARRSHRIVPITGGCDLNPVIFNKIASDVCEILNSYSVKAYDEYSHQRDLRHIVLRENDKGEIMLCLVMNCDSFEGELEFCKNILKEHPEIVSIVLNENSKNTNRIMGFYNRTLYNKGYIYDTLCGKKFRLSPTSFFQINRGAAEILYGEIEKLVQPEIDDIVLDLYCGVGSIGLSFAEKVRKVIGVENNESAVEDAHHNASVNEIYNAEFFNLDATKFSEKLKKFAILPDCIITDPPRKGCSATLLSNLVSLNPEKIVMVSCNPATLARDLRVLIDSGYEIKKVTPVDMFPRTEHVETAALVSKVIHREY
ncbi:MAG: 23S rRNA (uracil(1939)-C(5))-methyltransferase RlmD [Ruminococcaceae bacterium]|nr:23S rRNA (uracil(1939)-C(5))-methyltransferase RlmD [Oscillospiraceae bacterium]